MSKSSGLHLVLVRGDDPSKAWHLFDQFVKTTGGNDVDVNNFRDLFHKWEKLDSGNGVLFTRSAYGEGGEMSAKVVKITVGGELKNEVHQK